MTIVPPKRATRTYTQRLIAGPDAVFPLLCPVREADWIDGWDPLLVATQSGVAERDCVFITAAEPLDAIWYITRHEPAAGFVEMLKITPTVTACRLTIQLRPVAEGSEADITYAHTSLGPKGDEFIASFTEASYRAFMQEWESQVNHYLRHGSARRSTRPA
jgi:hypothetical protein